MNDRLVDRDLAQLFSNAFPNTLDTCVKYFDEDENLSFIVTGDIGAQWLRDTGNQFAHLYPLLGQDPQLAKLVKSVINTESVYIKQYPYCSSFQPVPQSGLPPSVNGYAKLVTVNPPVDNQTIFECKWELDSLAGFLKIVRSYYQYTNDSSFMNDNFAAAMEQILTVLHNQMPSNWAPNWDWVSYYNWTGLPGSDSHIIDNSGNGEPVKQTGMVQCKHRPSDDQTIFNFITSCNAMMSVELNHIATMLDTISNSSAGSPSNITQMAGLVGDLSTSIRAATLNYMMQNGIFAYESNGYGSHYFMDDPNVPSLLSMPYLGFLDRNDTLYTPTKQYALSPQNPYYAVAQDSSMFGISGPHVNATYVWPMSLITAVYSTDNDTEITDYLYTILNNTSGLGLIHESLSLYNASDYTRQWFAWANSYFAEMVLDLAQRKPNLIFNDSTPYYYGTRAIS